MFRSMETGEYRHDRLAWITANIMRLLLLLGPEMPTIDSGNKAYWSSIQTADRMVASGAENIVDLSLKSRTEWAIV